MSRHYLKLVKKALRSLRHPRLKRWNWWRVATKPIANRKLWIPCRHTVANGATIGVFCSLIIIIPAQTLIAALIAIRAGANLPIAMACCWISNLLTLGPLFWMQCMLGDWLRNTVGVPMPDFLTSDALSIPEVGTFNSASFLLGMVASAAIAAALAYGLVHAFAILMPHHLPNRQHKSREEAEEVSEAA